MVLEYREKYIDSLPESDNRKFFYSKRTETLFISIRLKTGGYTYDALYKYTEKYGYQFIRSIPYGNIIEVPEGNKNYLYLSDLRYKIDMDNLKSDLIDISSFRVSLKNKYNIPEDAYLDNIIYFDGYIYLLYGESLYSIFDSNNIEKWGVVLENINNRLSMEILDNRLHIIGVNHGNDLIISSFSDRKLQEKSILDNNNDLYSTVFENNIYLFTENCYAYKTGIEEGIHLSKASPIQKNRKETYSLNNTPEFVWSNGNKIHMISTNGDHYEIIGNVEEGNVLCRFPNKMSNPIIPITGGSIKKNTNIIKNTTFITRDINKLVTTFDISLSNNSNFENHSMCRCIDDRYIFISLGSTETEKCTNILYDTFTKKKFTFSFTDTIFRCMSSKLFDIFFIDVDTLCWIGKFTDKFSTCILEKNILKNTIEENYSFQFAPNYTFTISDSIELIRVIKVRDISKNIYKNICVCFSGLNIIFLDITKNTEGTALILNEIGRYASSVPVTDVVSDGYYIYIFDQLYGKTSKVLRFTISNNIISLYNTTYITAPLSGPLNYYSNSRFFYFNEYIYLAKDGYKMSIDNMYGFSRWHNNHHISSNGIYIPANNVVYYLAPYNNGFPLYKIFEKDYTYKVIEED